MTVACSRGRKRGLSRGTGNTVVLDELFAEPELPSLPPRSRERAGRDRDGNYRVSFSRYGILAP